MHLQDNQYQLVTLLQGKITDVLIDLRQESRGIIAIESVILEAGANDQLLISPGIAHGYVVTDGPAIIHYKSSMNYQETPQYGISCDSPELSTSWPSGTWIMSERDSQFPLLSEFLINQ
jgi:dTDP-4-dehydrorhamnose 3,5-epimerase